MEIPQDALAREFFTKQVKEFARTFRKMAFDTIDSLRAQDRDNYEHLISLLRDEPLARKFLLFQENNSKQIRKTILDTTNNVERLLLEYSENFAISFKEETTLCGLFQNEKPIEQKNGYGK